MSRVAMSRAAVVVLPVLLLAVAVSSVVATQTPSDTIEGCDRSGPRIAQGQTGMALQDTVLTVEVPSTGTFLSLPAPPDEALRLALFICHVESDSSIVIDALTGEEVSRVLGSPDAAAVLDEIASNARVDAVVRPTPPPVSGRGAMTPPVTGSGGLKGR